MVYYIRFLRTPQVGDLTKKGISLSAVVAITTDLGDAFFPKEQTLIVRIVDASGTGEILFAEDLIWQPNARVVKINITLSNKLTSRLVYVQVTTKETIAQITQYSLPDIIDVWSTKLLLKVKQRTDDLVERRLNLNSKCCVRMLEETGDSIARHIWDASIGFCSYFQKCYNNNDSDQLPKLTTFLREHKSKRLKVLEVGSGCGIVGIALAQLQKCDIILTDLEDAQGILQSNVKLAKPMAGSNILYQVLGWGPDLDNLSDSSFDLVLVSDCIYNPDSSILLVEALEKVCQQSSQVQIVVGFKRRHEADDVFFECMNACGFNVDEQVEILLPHAVTEYDTIEPRFEMFVYSLSGKAK